MTTLLKWSGDDVDGFDFETTAFNTAFTYVGANSGQDSPRARLKLNASANGQFIGKSPISSPADTYWRFTLRLTAYPSSSVPLIVPLTSGGASAWRIRLTSTGTLIIDDSTNTAKGTSSALPLNQDVRVELHANASGVEIRWWSDPDSTGAATGTLVSSAGTFLLVDNIRIGQGGASPILPELRIDDIKVTDGPAWIGPRTLPSAITSPKIAIIGDSLTSMSGANGKFIYDELVVRFIPTRNVYLWGVGGKRIAVADLTGRTSMLNYADALAQLGGMDHIIIALGTNDRPQVDATVNADIDTLLTTIGTGPKITWINLTSKGSASADDIRVNGLISAKLAARGNATLADWNAHIRAIDGGANPSPYWLTTDTTHMTMLGYQERAKFYVDQLVTNRQPWAAVRVGTALALAVYVGTEKVWP